MDYKELLQYCRSEAQKIVFEALVEHNSQPKVAKILDKSTGTISSHVERVRKYASEAMEKKKYDVPDGYDIKGTSTLFDEDGNAKLKWVKTSQEAKDMVEALKDTVDYLVESVDGKAKPSEQMFKTPSENNKLNLYITNDLHFGAMSWKEETQDKNYTLDIADNMLDHAMDNLIANSPQARECIVADLGDMTEMDDFKNATPSSGHSLDVDGRYSKVIKVAMMAMIKMIDKALVKYERVHFINISGNHDITTGHATRAFVSAWYRHEPRVSVCERPTHTKYFKWGKQLLGFAHGDGLKMMQAGEVMAMQEPHMFADSRYRDFHFGHNHKDKIVDGRLCKAESHRNIAPLNNWASHAGFGRGLGTMKCITYCDKYGEIARTIFNVGMIDEE